MPRPAISKDEKRWATQRLDNMQRILDECADRPDRLLLELQKLLNSFASAETVFGRDADAQFYSQLAIFTENLRRKLK